MGALGYVGQSFLYLTAIKYASAGLVALLLYLYPIFVAVLSIIFLQKNHTRQNHCAWLTLFGASLTVGPVSGQLIGVLHGNHCGVDLFHLHHRRHKRDEARHGGAIVHSHLRLRWRGIWTYYLHQRRTLACE